MFAAILYIITCSARNRIRQRLRRLREPRYMIGAVAGIGYLIFTLLIRARAFDASDNRRGRGVETAAASIVGLAGPAIGGVLLSCLALASWVMPFGSGLLEFTRAETAFLFPSPLSRWQLVVYRLMRSQFAVLTGALIMALAYPTGSVSGRVRGLIAVWVLLMTSHVFFTGVTLARARLHRRDGALGFVWPVLALSVGAVSSVLAPLLLLAQALPLDTLSDVRDAVIALAQHGWPRVLLWPFTVLLRPLFAQTGSEFVRTLIGAVGIYGVAVLWLIWADARSADAADASVERQVSQPARRTPRYVARPMAWQLGASGGPEVAFVWKSVLQTARAADRRTLTRMLVALTIVVGLSLFAARARGLVQVVGVFSAFGALFALFLGPQMIRMDLRQDLAHLELLRTWPVRGASVLRGEIIWPAALVTGLTWALGGLAMTLSLVSASGTPTAGRVAAWLSFLILVPGVVLAQYALHNAVAVIFPAWVPLGASRARGVDAVGQRLIVLAATWVGLLLALTPGIMATVVLSLLLRPLLGPWVLPAGALITTLSVVGEVLLATGALERLYESLDITSIERPD